MPKALVEVGGKPLLWHVISIYAAQGFTRFHPLTGYLGEMVSEFTEGQAWPEGVEVDCVDTGLDTPTGGRIHSAKDLISDRTFCVTYADGVADINLGSLLDFHNDHGRLATLTAVRPNLQWGVIDIGEGGAVEGFTEKPQTSTWINGGFFCFEPGALSFIGEGSVLEGSPLEDLSADDELRAFKHEGFWDCMDTYKDLVTLNDLWEKDEAPWLAR